MVRDHGMWADFDDEPTIPNACVIGQPIGQGDAGDETEIDDTAITRRKSGSSMVVLPVLDPECAPVTPMRSPNFDLDFDPHAPTPLPVLRLPTEAMRPVVKGKPVPPSPVQRPRKPVVYRPPSTRSTRTLRLAFALMSLTAMALTFVLLTNS